MVILEGLVENLLELWCQEGYKDVIYGVSNHKIRHQSSMCYVISVFLTVPLFGQQCVIGVFPDQTHVFCFLSSFTPDNQIGKIWCSCSMQKVMLLE